MRRGQEGLGFGFLFLLGLLAVLVSVAVWIIRRVGHDRGGAVPSVAASDPLDIARQRLAAGEITLEEHEEIRERLRH
ncbi:MAG: hypothetical protein ACLFV5_04125 [Anaerolineales bacterium]